MKMKSIICGAMSLSSMMLMASDTPEVSDVVMSQASFGRMVTVTYKLSNAANGAVVTFDVETNCTVNGETKWASIGGEAVCKAQGAVWRKVTSSDADSEGKYTITWRPDLSWEGHKVTLAEGGARAVVTAWALDNTPDYMVVDLAAENIVRYYPGVDFLPGSEWGQIGAVTNNFAYRTSKLLMRKILAADVEWTMGSASGEIKRQEYETPHLVMLTNNYYIGVFEVTQAQWANIATNSSAVANLTVDGAMRPMEKISYNEIRNSKSATANTDYDWPAAPNPSSFLGLLRMKTGIDFDLPSEAQWEFAARAGHGSGFWNDGSDIQNLDSNDDNLNRLGRYRGDNPGGNSLDTTLGPNDGGTAIVGSYAPSDWGLYDMHGNIYEACLDWFEEDITRYNGKVNIDPANRSKTLSGESGTRRVFKGGAWSYLAGNSRPAFRSNATPNNRLSNNGFRVVCTAGLK